MSGEIVEFSMDSLEVAELDRLAAIYAGGDRDALLREAMRFMASRERAERLQRIQARVHDTIHAPSTVDCDDADPTELSDKGRTP
jgi:hypothetical protein